MEMLILKLMLSSVLLSTFGYADTNQIIGLTCSGPDSDTNESEYQSNLTDLLNSLAANGPSHNGFYTATSGKGANMLYGLTQCRGDVPAADCSACIRNSTMASGCAHAKNVTVWLRWCILRYSNVSFFGVVDQSAMATTNDTNFEDPNVVAAELNFMNALAATAPKQTLMFQTSVLDVGQSGKRFGMAQCTRDIGIIDCAKCLDTQLVTFRTTIGNKRGWEIYGSSCSMWYHDTQFYFNYTLPANEGGIRCSPHRYAISMIGLVLVFLLALQPWNSLFLVS